MGKKERILELIIEFDGLTYKRIIELYNERYNPSTITKETGYIFLQRLKGYNKKTKKFDNPILIRAESKDNVKGKCFFYKPTALALNQETFSDKINDLEYLKSLFEKEKVEIIGSKLTKDDFKRLELI